MERYVFIHGSSVGQSAFVPAGAPELICNDLATRYFQGRTLRQKESAARKAMFVDLYNGPQGIFSVYSFVNNACFGANGREGQYFAISILCKGVYIYPESIYSMLNSAYNTIFKNGKIFRDIENGECQYVISQFSEQKDYLAAFLKKVEEAFDKLTNGEGKVISSNVNTADYNSWYGYKVNLDVCNSTSALKALTEVGRLYISEEYESASKTISILKAQVQKLQAEKTEIEAKHIEAKRSQKSKERDEIAELNSQIRQKEIEINTLQKDNESYEVSINAVRKELDKYAKVGKAVTDFQSKKSQSQTKGWQDMSKWILLILIFILTLLSTLVNFGFFRNLSPLPEKEQTGENKEVVGSTESKQVSSAATSLIVTPKEVTFTSEGGTSAVLVATDGTWELPSLNDVEWISCSKKDGSTFEIIASANTGEERTLTFTIKSDQLEKQVKVLQYAAPKNKSSNISYIINVTDATTGISIQSGETVHPGQKLNVVVSNPSKVATGYGWRYSNCSGDDRDRNVKEVVVTVGDDTSKDVIIAYGGLSNIKLRTQFRLKISNVE
ncbi:MAG: hypothetical protein IKK23_09095 [Bacteroidales bacterium]|nr:hypothetical protein [Bacteroidales bacterium]